MPLTLEIPTRELFDEKELRFFYSPRTVLKLEHSLISLSEWESKWKRPYLVQPVDPGRGTGLHTLHDDESQSG